MTDWEQVKSAVQLSMTQGSAQGRDALLDCWRATAHGDHAYRCVIAHYLADLQSSLDDEVAWDQRALVEHAFLTDEDLAPVGINSTADMAPSLHLNLGDGYLRQGRLSDALITGFLCQPGRRRAMT